MAQPARRNSKGGLSELEKELREKEAALQRQMAEMQALVRGAPAKRKRLGEEQHQRSSELPATTRPGNDRTWRLRADVGTAATPESLINRPLRSEVRQARVQFIILLLVLVGLLFLILALLT